MPHISTYTDARRDMRQIAFDLAAQGFKIFPLRANDKLPIPGIRWKDLICADEMAAWNTWSLPEYRDSNIGIHCEDMIVVDVDDYKTAADTGALAALDLPPTLTVQTARGGRHLYFTGPNVGNRVGHLGAGLDVRSLGGYVVGPGSVTENGEYRVIDDRPRAAAPQTLIDRCKAAKEIVQRESVDWQKDTPAHRLEDAKQYLATAPNAVEGTRNDTLYRVATELWDRGIEAKNALAMLTEPHGWNDLRCLPPLDLSELRKTFESAYRSAQNPFGCRAADQVFGAVEIVEPENCLLPLSISAADLLAKPVPPFEWLVGGMIPAHGVTLLYGDGGIGKSWIALQLAAGVTAGKPWLGVEVQRSGRAFYLSAEDGHDDLHRRLTAIAAAQGIDPADLAGLRLIDLSLAPTTAFATFDRDNAMKETHVWHDLRKLVDRHRPALVVVDTLADVFSGDEISKAHAREFIHLLHRFSKEQQTAFVVLAHPSLAGMESGRGTSGNTAWSNSVRSRLYLEKKTERGKELRKLTVMKANHAATGTAISVVWADGKGFLRIDEAETAARSNEAKGVFLDCLRATAEPVSKRKGWNYAPQIFENLAAARGFSKDDMRAAMEQLEAEGRVQTVEYRKDGHTRYRLAETVLGADGTPTAPAALFDDAIDPDEPSAEDLGRASRAILDGLNTASHSASAIAQLLRRRDPALRRFPQRALVGLLADKLGGQGVSVGGDRVRFVVESNGGKGRPCQSIRLEAADD